MRLKKPSRFDFDLICVGAGPAGLKIAEIACSQGKRVGLIEAGALGGECLNSGCIPTKTLLGVTNSYLETISAKRRGIEGSSFLSYQAAQNFKNQVVSQQGPSKNDLAKAGIVLITGRAHFLSPWVVGVNREHFSAKNFVISTGGYSFIPPIKGLDSYLTHKDALSLNQPPKSLFIIGGGAIGCEFAHLFSVFGSRVYLAEAASNLLPAEDIEVGQLTSQLFRRQKVSVLTDFRVLEIGQRGNNKTVYWEQGGKRGEAMVDQILVAAGKRPATDIGLENAGVKYTEAGVKVNRYLQTNQPHIYAAGDVTGSYCFTHTALYQAQVVAHNLLHFPLKKTSYRAVPSCIFLELEVASVGLKEQQLKEQKRAYKKSIVGLSQIARSKTSGQASGFVKILTSKTKVILGASIVAPRAGEMIHQLTLAINLSLTTGDLTKTIYAFPTWGEAIWLACKEIEDS